MDSLDKSLQAGLSLEQEAAVKMLTSGCSVRYTALVIGVKQATVSAWIARDTAFKSRLKEAAISNPADDGKPEEKSANSVESDETEELAEPVRG